MKSSVFLSFLAFAALLGCKRQGEQLKHSEGAQDHSAANRVLCQDKLVDGCIEHHAFPPTIPQPPIKIDEHGQTADDLKLSSITFDPKNPWYQRCASEIDRRLIGKDPAIAKPWRDATQNLPTSWAYGLNLTAVTHLRYGPRGVAVTPRHVLFTKHYGYHPRVGDPIRFLTMDNRLIERKVAALRYVASDDPGNFTIDITVVRLDSDLPGSITPMKLVKPDDNAYRDLAVVYCPVLRIDQEAKALILRAAPGSLSERSARFWKAWPDSRYPDDTMVTTYEKFYEDMISGDSSSPSIAVYSDDNGVSTYLLSQVTWAGPGEGTRTANQAELIQNIIRGFGDIDKRYLLRFGPHEYAGHARPFCTVGAKRLGQTGDCDVIVAGSGDKVDGVPKINATPKGGWTSRLDSWQTTASCPPNDQLFMTGSLAGPGGESSICESNSVSPAIEPSCLIDVTRVGDSNRCRASLKWNKDSGPVSSYKFAGADYSWDGLNSKISIFGESGPAAFTLSADFNGDGLLDKAVKNSQNQWSVSLRLVNNDFSVPRVWGAWPSAKGPWINLMTADFNNDKKSDIIGRSSVTGEWYVLLARPKALSFRIMLAGKLDISAPIGETLVGDVNNDSFSDLIWRNTKTGDWWYRQGSANGLGSVPYKFGNWTPGVQWLNTRFLDVDGDGRGEMIGMTSAGRWWVSTLRQSGSQILMNHSRAFHWNEAQLWMNLPCVKGELTSFEYQITGPGGSSVCSASIK
jgi:hypothetical protein